VVLAVPPVVVVVLEGLVLTVLSQAMVGERVVWA